MQWPSYALLYFFLIWLLTYETIVANAIRHWNDVPSGRDGRVVYGTGLENQRG